MQVLKGCSGSLMWTFWPFKFSFDIDILVFWPLFTKIGQLFIQYSGHTAHKTSIFFIFVVTKVVTDTFKVDKMFFLQIMKKFLILYALIIFCIHELQ